MKVRPIALAALITALGLAGPAIAQSPSRVAIAPDPRAAYPGPGTNHDYYAIDGGFGHYGLPGQSPSYAGYGLSGYGPGDNLNEFFVPWYGPTSGAVRNQPAPVVRSRPSASTKSAKGGLVKPRALPVPVPPRARRAF